MSPEPKQVVALVAILVLALSTVVVWDLAGERTRLATSAEKADAVAGKVPTRQAPGDYDGDSVADSRDACPTRPETANGFQDGDGCPDVVATTGAS